LPGKALKYLMSTYPSPHAALRLVTLLWLTLITVDLAQGESLTGQDAVGLADGEALILHPDGRGGATIVARVKIDEWAGLATAR
jgi:hypothetical protein